MAPLISSAKSTLDYPLYACDFDPVDSSRLFVAGGGGAGRTGVGNKITLLDASKAEELVEADEISLSKEEDNVTSFAAGQRKGKATQLFAGVNSSPADVANGKNAHFRVFSAEPAPKNEGRNRSLIKEVSRAPLFTAIERDSYQRITRLSKAYPNQAQIGALCTGLAKKNEIVLFETSVAPPRPLGSLHLDKEAVDCDFIQTGEREYLFAYCDTYKIYTKTISTVKDNGEEPQCVYITPSSDSHEKPTVPSFRGLRWLTKDLVLMLTNIHGSNGVCLQMLRIQPSGKCHARLVQSTRLPSSISKATGIAVCNLTPPVSPTTSQGYTQFVIAIAGHDISISLFKVDLQVEAGVSMPTNIKAFRTIKSVHPLQITSIAFSNYTPPQHPVTPSTPPQYLKLASVGMSNTVVVHTLPLFPVPLSMKRGQSKTPRYVVALPSTAFYWGFAIIASAIGIVIAAIFAQGLMELWGGVPVRLNTKQYLPLTWQEHLNKPYELPNGYASSSTTSFPAANSAAQGYNHHIGVPTDSSDEVGGIPQPNFFENLQAGSAEGVFIIKEADEGNGIHVAAHDEDVDGPHGAKTWEELPHEQKEGWKRKLKDAGHWIEDMGETILKGVVFGEIAGAVGQAVGA